MAWDFKFKDNHVILFFFAMVAEAVSLRVWSSSSAQTTAANYQSRSPILALDWVSPADSLVGHNATYHITMVTMYHPSCSCC